MSDELIKEFQTKAAEKDLNPQQLADTLGVCVTTVENWVEGRCEPHGYNKQQIHKWLNGTLETKDADNRGCRIRDCEFPPQYEYENPHSAAQGQYCEYHMDSRRSDMDATDWIELGYAEVLA